MLILKAFINEHLIDEIYIHNKGPLESKGNYRYGIVKPEGDFEEIHHKRRKGWLPLALKVLELILKKEEGL